MYMTNMDFVMNMNFVRLTSLQLTVQQYNDIRITDKQDNSSSFFFNQEWQFGAKKARDALYKEIEQLRYDIQALSRVANPLGKVLDHMQEDVEVMRQELNQWTKTYDETSKELIKQKTSVFACCLPSNQLQLDIKDTGVGIITHHSPPTWWYGPGL